MSSFPLADSPVCVLLVDQPSEMRLAIERTLAAEGYQVHIATNRHEAAAEVRENSIHLVIMNMLMPHAEGIGTLMAIRSLAPTMKLIAMPGESGDQAGHFLPLAKSLGASAILTHPLDHQLMLKTVRGLLAQDLHQMAC
jgi:two-component system response regulator MprA